MPRTPLQGAAFLLGFWIALWLSPFGASGEPLASAAAASLSNAAAPYAELEAGLHEGVNRVRSDRHLIPLERRPELDAVARAHSRDMANRHFFDHTNPEGEVAPDRLIRAQVRGFSLAAENLGITDRPDPNREILHGWIQSEVHRQNLYAPPFNATGIGIARAPNGSLIYTQIYVTYPR